MKKSTFVIYSVFLVILPMASVAQAIPDSEDQLSIATSTSVPDPQVLTELTEMEIKQKSSVLCDAAKDLTLPRDFDIEMALYEPQITSAVGADVSVMLIGCSQLTQCNTADDCPCPAPDCGCGWHPSCGFNICLCESYCWGG